MKGRARETHFDDLGVLSGREAFVSLAKTETGEQRVLQPQGHRHPVSVARPANDHTVAFKRELKRPVHHRVAHETPSPVKVKVRTPVLTLGWKSYAATPVTQELCAPARVNDSLPHLDNRVIHRAIKGVPYPKLGSEAFASGHSPKLNPIARTPQTQRAIAARRQRNLRVPKTLRAATISERRAA